MPVVGDARCACGETYRYAVSAIDERFWAAEEGAFSDRPLGEARCVRCGEDLYALLPRHLLAGADIAWRPFTRRREQPPRDER